MKACRLIARRTEGSLDMSHDVTTSTRLASVGVLAGALADGLRALGPNVATIVNQDAGSGLADGLLRLQRVAAFCGFWGVGSYLGALIELTNQVEHLIAQKANLEDRRGRVTVLVNGINALGVYLRDLAAGHIVSIRLLNESFAQVIRRARPELLNFSPEEAKPLLFMAAPPSIEVDALWVPEPGAGHKALVEALSEALAGGDLTVAALQSISQANPYRSLSGLFEASASCLDTLDPDYVADLRDEMGEILASLSKGVPVVPPVPHAFTFSAILYHLATIEDPLPQQQRIRARYGLTDARGEALALQETATKFAEAMERVKVGLEKAVPTMSGISVQRDAAEIAKHADRLPSPAFQLLAKLLHQLTQEWGDRPSQGDWERAMILVLLMLEAANTWGHPLPQDELLVQARRIEQGQPAGVCLSIQRRVTNAALQSLIQKLQARMESTAKEADALVSDGPITPADEGLASQVGQSIAAHLRAIAAIILTIGLVRGADAAERVANAAADTASWVDPGRLQNLVRGLASLRVFISRLRPGSLLDLDDGDDHFAEHLAAQQAPAVLDDRSALPEAVSPEDVEPESVREPLPEVEPVLRAPPQTTDPIEADQKVMPAATSELEPGEELASAGADVEPIVDQPLPQEFGNLVPASLTPAAHSDFLDMASPSFDLSTEGVPSTLDWDVEDLTREFLGAAEEKQDAPRLSDPVLLEIMFDEAATCLDGIAACMLKLDSDPLAVAEIRRLVHTLKGGARTCGLEASGAVLHAMEDRLDLVPDGEGALSPFKAAFDAGIADVRNRIEKAQEIAEAARLTIPDGGASAIRAAQAIEPGPGPETAGDGSSEVGEAQASGVSEASSDAVRGLQSAEQGGRIAEQTMRVPAKLVSSVGDASGKVQTASRQSLDNLLSMERSVRSLLDNLAKLQPAIQELEQHSISGTPTGRSTGGGHGFDHLEFDRYTALKDVVSRVQEGFSDTWVSAKAISESLRRGLQTSKEGEASSGEGQRAASELLLVSIESQQARLERVVLRACEDLGKQADLTVDPAAKIPATAINRIVPALEHVLRNAVAHGVESPDIRAQSGKQLRGRITVGLPLDGRVEGGAVRLAVRDDGAGIDVARVRSVAVRRGLIPESAVLTDAAVRDLLFLPGFSTAAAVNEVAGRGVGLDVVRSALVSMGGNVSVSPVPSGGTEFILTIPTDVASMAVVTVSAAGFSCHVPLSLVKRVVPLSAGLDVTVDPDGAVARIDGVTYPLLDLRRRVPVIDEQSRSSSIHSRGHLVLMKDTSITTAVYVDQVGHQQRVVTKPLGPIVRDVPGMLAGAVAADGSVMLIVNPMQLPEVTLAPEGVLKSEASRPTVLVVDDSETVRVHTARTLERNGYSVVAVPGGAMALQSLEEGLDPAAVLCDLEMPGMSGYDLLSELKGRATTSAIPVVIISSRSASKYQERALELGAAAYLTKPWDESALLRTLHANTPERV